jgi:hypothetical protein
MPSDPLTQSVLAAAAAGCESFHAALAVAVTQVQGFLEARRAPIPAERAAHELGAFGTEHIDGDRFGTLFADTVTTDAAALERVDRAHDLLTRLLARGGPYVTRVTPSGDLRAGVEIALAEIGRAFAAARSVQLVRTGSPTGEVGDALAPFPYRRWNHFERAIAPPLVVEVEGGDLQVGGLAEFLDGGQKIVLVAHGAAPGAPLVRLITPAVTVVQTSAEAGLELISGAEGPAAIAVMPVGAAQFTHLPGAGPVWERLSVASMPAGEPAAAVGSFSVFQQQQELALLRELTSAPPSAAPPADAGKGEPTAVPAAAATAAPDPAGQLAAWLLDQSGLTQG